MPHELWTLRVPPPNITSTVLRTQNLTRSKDASTTLQNGWRKQAPLNLSRLSSSQQWKNIRMGSRGSLFNQQVNEKLRILGGRLLENRIVKAAYSVAYYLHERIYPRRMQRGRITPRMGSCWKEPVDLSVISAFSDFLIEIRMCSGVKMHSSRCIAISTY